jgi:outer membrane protein OmpA-like peptidoglycan-associated protein
MRSRLAAIAALALLVPLFTPLTAQAAGTQTITREVVIPAPPAAAFAGTSGGDGFDVSLVDGRIYNVFHHGYSTFTVACLEESTGAKCDLVDDDSPWPKTLTDATYGDVGSPGQSWTFVSPDQTKMYGWAHKNDEHGGMMCMELDASAADTNPSCGYTRLTEIRPSGGSPEVVPVQAWAAQDFGSNARVGDRVYASFVTAATPSETWLACFDLALGAECADAPFLVPNISGAGTREARAIAIGTNVYIATPVTGGQSLTCFDTTTNDECAAEGENWPRSLISGNTYSPTPIVDTTGNVTGICTLNGVNTKCFDPETGADVATPTVLASSTYHPNEWWGATHLVGTRLIIPDSFNNKVHCVDFSQSPAVNCANFPYVASNMWLLYSATPDPNRAGCFWLNADSGSGQIQNFDAFTGEAGCANSLRVSTTQFVPDLANCPVIDWLSFRVDDPTEWTAATVDATTPGGIALAGGTAIEIPDAGVEVDLAGVDFTGIASPMFSFAFTGTTIPDTGVKTTFTFITDDAPACAEGPYKKPPPGGGGQNPSLTVDRIMVPLGPPVIGGNPAVGSSLTCTPPAFSNDVTSWIVTFRVNGVAQTSVVSTGAAPTATLLLTPAMVGAAIECVVQANGQQSSGFTTADGPRVVAAPVTPPVVTPPVVTPPVVTPPAVVNAGKQVPLSAKSTRLTWVPALDAVSYQVKVNGVVVCKGTTTTCKVPSLLGPKAKIQVESLNASGGITTTTLPVYAPKKPVPALSVNFAESSAALTPLAIRKLDGFVALMKAQGFTRVVIEGHTDGQGGSKGARALSDRRAKAVAGYLDRFLTVKIAQVPQGETKPVASNATSAGQAKNRRADIAVW